MTAEVSDIAEDPLGLFTHGDADLCINAIADAAPLAHDILVAASCCRERAATLLGNVTILAPEPPADNPGALNVGESHEFDDIDLGSLCRIRHSCATAVSECAACCDMFIGSPRTTLEYFCFAGSSGVSCAPFYFHLGEVENFDFAAADAVIGFKGTKNPKQFRIYLYL